MKRCRSVLLDVSLRASSSCKKDGGGRCLCSLDALGVIVRHGCVFRRPEQHFVQRVERKPNRTNSHGGAIAPAVVGLASLSLRPAVK